MSDRPHRPILVLLTSNWLTMTGSGLVTLAGFAWLFLLPLNLRGHVPNPYVGLLVFIAIPVVFFAGLALIPVGIAMARRHGQVAFDNVEARRTAWRRTAVFFIVMTAANVVIGSQASYRAVEHMETQQFCGQSCHVMQPQYTAHRTLPHQAVDCVSCHVTPGAEGWVKSKTAGMRQLLMVTLNRYPRPIESALESGRLAPSAETCEHCHARESNLGPRLRVIPAYAEDEKNSRTDTVLMMLVGGGAGGGIHGAHLGAGVEIRFAAADTKRQMIPRVEYRNTKTGQARTYFAGGATAETTKALATFGMQCADCHNRIAHAFYPPGQAIDRAMAAGNLPTDLPFLKKAGMALLGANYGSQAEASREIPAGLLRYFTQEQPQVLAQRRPEIEAAANGLVTIYGRNVFPDFRVNGDTYVDNLGHSNGAGCFRCHDNDHTASPGSGETRVLAQDCEACHHALAVGEATPDILKTLGLGVPVSERK